MPKPQPNKAGYICVGVILGAHGIKGAVRTKSFCDLPENLGAYGPLITLENATFTPTKAQADAKGAVRLFLKEVRDRNHAETLAKTYLYVPKSAIPNDDNQHLRANLIGTPAFLHGKNVGTLQAIFSNGAQDILELKIAEDADTVLIPWVEDYADVQEDKINLTAAAQAFFEL